MAEARWQRRWAVTTHEDDDMSVVEESIMPIKA